MSPESYKAMMAEMGISRGKLEEDAEIGGSPYGSQLLKEPTYLNESASTVAPKPPMDEVPEHLRCNTLVAERARAWWQGLSPEGRKKASLRLTANAKAPKRKSYNGRSQGRKRVTT